MAEDQKLRVVLAKSGLCERHGDAKPVARTLRDAGMEVMCTGLHQRPEEIVATVLQQDADAVGLPVNSGAHIALVPRVLGLLREQGG